MEHRSRTHWRAPTSSEFLFELLPLPPATMTTMDLRPRSELDASLAPEAAWCSATPWHPLAGSEARSFTILAFADRVGDANLLGENLERALGGLPGSTRTERPSSTVLSLHMTHTRETAATHASSEPSTRPTTPAVVGS